jgi:hypothetical protein
VLSAIGSFFGKRPAAGTPAVAPAQAAAAAYGPANELEDLAASSPAVAVQAVPSLLRQAAEQTASSPSTPVSPALQSLPERLSQGSDLSWLMPPSSDAAPQGGVPWLVPPATDAAPGNASGNTSVLLQPPPFWPESHEASSPVGAPSQTGAAIPNPPDAQQRTITEITKPQPSELSKILGIVMGLGSSIFGGKSSGSFGSGGGGGLFGSLFGGSSGGSGGDSGGALGDDSGGGDLFDSDAGSGLDDLFMAGGGKVPDIPFFAVGGRFNGKVSGPGTGTSDSINAKLSRGEFVTKASATSKYLPLLQQINSDTVKFAMGGLVGYDDGGYVAPSMAYVSAERGAGQMAAASTRIAGSTSSSSISTRNYGDTHNHYIDARGSTDPAQTTANIDRYMKKAGPQIAAAAVHAVKDQQMRRAPSAK